MARKGEEDRNKIPRKRNWLTKQGKQYCEQEFRWKNTQKKTHDNSSIFLWHHRIVLHNYDTTEYTKIQNWKSWLIKCFINHYINLNILFNLNVLSWE